jgi:hypothetical protein
VPASLSVKSGTAGAKGIFMKIKQNTESIFEKHKMANGSYYYCISNYRSIARLGGKKKQ